MFEPLSDRELSDLFRQMQKDLDAKGGVLTDKNLLACEVENLYRLRQTVYQLQANIRGGDTAIRALEDSVSVLEGEILSIGIWLPQINRDCIPTDCANCGAAIGNCPSDREWLCEKCYAEEITT